MDWYDDHDTLVSIATYAFDEGLLRGGQEIIDFFEKPWHYPELHTEWAQWVHLSDKAGR